MTEFCSSKDHLQNTLNLLLTQFFPPLFITYSEMSIAVYWTVEGNSDQLNLGAEQQRAELKYKQSF